MGNKKKSLTKYIWHCTVKPGKGYFHTVLFSLIYEMELGISVITKLQIFFIYLFFFFLGQVGLMEVLNGRPLPISDAS